MMTGSRYTTHAASSELFSFLWVWEIPSTRNRAACHDTQETFAAQHSCSDAGLALWVFSAQLLLSGKWLGLDPLHRTLCQTFLGLGVFPSFRLHCCVLKFISKTEHIASLQPKRNFLLSSVAQAEVEATWVPQVYSTSLPCHLDCIAFLFMCNQLDYPC